MRFSGSSIGIMSLDLFLPSIYLCHLYFFPNQRFQRLFVILNQKTKNLRQMVRKYKVTVLARIKRDPKFARALYTEAVNSLLDGETDEGLSILRDLVHASITFKKLARQTGFGEKALHRMLSRRGNPTTRNLFPVTKTISRDLGIKPEIK